MLGRIDIRDAGVIDGEVQRRFGVMRAVDQVVRRARVRVARLVVGIAQQSAPRSSRTAMAPAAAERDRAHGLAPRVVLERLGGGAGPDAPKPVAAAPASKMPRPSRARRSSSPLPATGVSESAGVVDSTLGNTHECLPRRMGVCRALFGDFLQAEKFCSRPEAMSRLPRDAFLTDGGDAASSARTARTPAPAPTSRWRSATSSAQMSR